MADDKEKRCPFCGGPIDPEEMDPLLKPIKDECWDCPWYKKIVEAMAPVLMIVRAKEAGDDKRRL